MKNFIGALLYGAGAALGSALMAGLIDELSDPCKRANIKNFIGGIKSKLFKTKEG